MITFSLLTVGGLAWGIYLFFSVVAMSVFSLGDSLRRGIPASSLVMTRAEAESLMAARRKQRSSTQRENSDEQLDTPWYVPARERQWWPSMEADVRGLVSVG
jgi:hypothetical protein